MYLWTTFVCLPPNPFESCLDHLYIASSGHWLLLVYFPTWLWIENFILWWNGEPTFGRLRGPVSQVYNSYVGGVHLLRLGVDYYPICLTSCPAKLKRDITINWSSFKFSWIGSKVSLKRAFTKLPTSMNMPPHSWLMWSEPPSHHCGGSEILSMAQILG